MIYWLMDLVRIVFGVKIPAAFSYYSTRMMLAALTSLIISIVLGPRFIKKLYELKIGQSVRTEDCPPLVRGLHEKKKDTPTMGGALILFSMLISMFLWMDLAHIFTLFLLVTTLVMGGVGARDDYLKLKYKNSRGLSGKKKLLIQLVLSLGIAAYLLSPYINSSSVLTTVYSPPTVKEIVVGTTDAAQTSKGLNVVQLPLQDYASRLYLPFIKDPIVQFSGVFLICSALLIIFVVTGSSNAVNLTDGLDGLAAGCLIMVSICLAGIAFVSNNIDLAGYLNILYIEGSGEIAIYLSALVGACIGFLWYNGYPAQVFMGDTGSLALGAIIGVSAVLLKRELLLGVIGGVFVMETLSVIIQVCSFRYRNKKRVFLCTPIHHHFECMGWPETKVVLRFWIVGFLLAILGLASIKFQ